MKILFIAPSAYLLGGVQDWLYTTVIGLRKRGHDVDVAVPNNHFHNGRNFNSHFVGLEAYFFRNNSGTNEGGVRGLEKLLRNKKADIIVGVNIGNLFEAISRIDRNTRGKFVMSLHAIEHNYYEDIKEFKTLLDGVIATNRLSVLLAEKIGGIDQKRIYYAPYGVEQDESGSTRRLHHLPLIIAWVGRIEQAQKRAGDIKGILENLDQLGLNYKLEIAGDGPEKDQLIAEISTWIEMGRVEFHGLIEKGCLGLFYKRCHVLLITSEWETGPIVAWEAISSGLAVVTSNYIGSKAEETLINDKTALTFNVGDTQAAAKQINRLINEDLRQKLHLNAKRIIASKYSTEASLNAWESAFQAVKNSEDLIEYTEKKVKIRTRPAGRLEKYLGLEGSEFIRSLLPRRTARNAGDEWPHSLQGIKNQDWILEYAKELEDAD
jgi:glycosyltransferase involved in cell wall biosynthesis